jgi:hypothetical protein
MLFSSSLDRRFLLDLLYRLNEHFFSSFGEYTVFYVVSVMGASLSGRTFSSQIVGSLSLEKGGSLSGVISETTSKNPFYFPQKKCLSLLRSSTSSSESGFTLLKPTSQNVYSDLRIYIRHRPLIPNNFSLIYFPPIEERRGGGNRNNYIPPPRKPGSPSADFSTLFKI